MNGNKSEMEMDRVSKLKDIVEKSLEQNGEMQKFRSMIRLRVLNILRDGDKAPMTQLVNTNSRSSQLHKIIHQLIMEYFHWMGYYYTMETFETESACDPKALYNVKQTLKFRPNVNLSLDKQLPVLLSLLKNTLEMEWNGCCYVRTKTDKKTNWWKKKFYEWIGSYLWILVIYACSWCLFNSIGIVALANGNYFNSFSSGP